MNRADRIAIAAAAALVALAAARLAPPWGEPVATEPPTAAESAVAPAPLPPLDALREVGARNLFAPSRGHGTAVAAAGAVAPPTADLIGVVETTGRRTAVFRLADGSRRVVPEGGTLAGWTLAEVTRGRVTLRRLSAVATIDMTRRPPPSAPSAEP